MDRQEFLRVRRFSIGGSDCAAACGLDPYKSNLRLYYEKTGEIDLSDEENEFMLWGTIHEPAIAKEYARRTGRSIRRHKQATSKTHPYMTANVDRLIMGDPRGPGQLECKCLNAFSPWRNVASTGDTPDRHYLQVQHNLAVTGWSWGSFAYLVGGNKMQWFDFERDDDCIAMLLKAEAIFWGHVQRKEPPEAIVCPDVEATIRKAFPLADGDVVDVSAEVEEWAVAEGELAWEIKSLEDQRSLLRAKIMQRIGSSMGCRFPTGWGYTFTNNKPTVKEQINLDLLKGQYPEIAAKVIKSVEVPGARVLRPLKVKLD